MADTQEEQDGHNVTRPITAAAYGFFPIPDNPILATDNLKYRTVVPIFEISDNSIRKKK